MPKLKNRAYRPCIKCGRKKRIDLCLICDRLAYHARMHLKYAKQRREYQRAVYDEMRAVRTECPDCGHMKMTLECLKCNSKAYHQHYYRQHRIHLIQLARIWQLNHPEYRQSVKA